MLQAQNGWEVRYLPQYRYINAVHFIDATHVSVVGGHPFNDSITFYSYSSTAAESWDFFHDRYPGNMIKDMLFLDKNRGIAVGYNAKIHKTATGGDGWNLSSFQLDLGNTNFNKIHKTASGNIYVAGGLNRGQAMLLSSGNNGNTWSVLPQFENHELYTVSSAGNRLFIAGTDNCFESALEGSFIWSPVTVSGQVGQVDYTAMAFYNENLGFCVGGTRAPDSTHVVLKTNDGGISWNCILEEQGSCLNAVFILDENTLYVAGDDGMLMKSNDCGETWQAIIINNIPNVHFYTINFLNPHYGVVAGKFGHYVAFNDGFPIAVTNEAVNVGSYKASLKAQAISGDNNCTAYFCYGTDENTENQIEIGNISGYTISTITSDINELQTNTRYFFRLKLSSNVYGDVYGELKSFYTGNPIPNWDFEYWTGNLPNDWFFEYSNLPLQDMPDLPFYNNNYGYLSNQSIAISEVVLESGNIRGEIYTDKFAVTTRHKTLEGYLKYQPEHSDTATITVHMYAGNDVVGTGVFPKTRFHTHYDDYWKKFVMLIAYVNDEVIPDFAKITISSTTATQKSASVLMVDKLSFDGDYLPVEEQQQKHEYSLYPNPCNNEVLLVNHELHTACVWVIYNITGKVVLHGNFDKPVQHISVSQLPKGIYLFAVYTQNSEITTFKLIKE